MINDKKIITIQDISCYGQCSSTVALPILSCFGYETIVLPSMILSTHTGGFKGFQIVDLSDKINLFLDHYQSLNLKFDVLYAAYLGTDKVVDIVHRANDFFLRENSLFVLDPVMGDNGKLYPQFNEDYVASIKTLVSKADIIIPNLTEACALTGIEYEDKYDEEYIKNVVLKLKDLGAKKIIITGVTYKSDRLGVISYDKEMKYYEHERIEKGCHGTGDVFASTFLGSYLNNSDLYEASKIAADFVVKCIKNTIQDKDHWYGVKFEPLLKDLVK